MAKRKRLDVPKDAVSPDLETKSAFPSPRARMPIAEVAGEVAGRAALEEVAREMTAAEDEGRVVKKMAIASIVPDHLARDRMVLEEDEMEALTGSIRDRGQQTPIEVVRLSGGKYGLISGLRRLEALRRLGAETVLALIKTPEDSQAAYQAMIEENEIRAGLSFYERANIAVVAVGQGVYPDPRAAVKGLFAQAPKAKRSKILKFVTIRDALGGSLKFPAAIPEHLGIALVKAMEADAELAARLSRALQDAGVKTPEGERKVLDAALKRPRVEPGRDEIAPGLMLEAKTGRILLTGRAVDEALLARLRDFLVQSAAKP